MVGKDEGVGRFQGAGKAHTDDFSPCSPRHQQLTALGLPEPLHCTSLLSVYFSCTICPGISWTQKPTNPLWQWVPYLHTCWLEQTPHFDLFGSFQNPCLIKKKNVSASCIPIKYTGTRKKLNDLSKFIVNYPNDCRTLNPEMLTSWPKIRQYIFFFFFCEE